MRIAARNGRISKQSEEQHPEAVVEPTSTPGEPLIELQVDVVEEPEKEKSSCSSDDKDEPEIHLDKKFEALNEELARSIQDFVAHMLRQVEDVKGDSAYIPTLEEIDRGCRVIEMEKVESRGLIQGVALPEEYDLMSERAHDGLIDEVERSSPDSLNSAETAEPVSAALDRENIAGDIGKFVRDSLKSVSIDVLSPPRGPTREGFEVGAEEDRMREIDMSQQLVCANGEILSNRDIGLIITSLNDEALMSLNVRVTTKSIPY